MSNDEHWNRSTKAQQRRVLGLVMFELRLHTMCGPPIATRIDLLRLRIAELEAEAAGAAGARLADTTTDTAEPAEKQPALPWHGAGKDEGATDGAQEGP